MPRHIEEVTAERMHTIEIPDSVDLSLVREFISPWMTDFTEVDGGRSYAVNSKRLEIISKRTATIEEINASCTIASRIVGVLFGIEAGNR